MAWALDVAAKAQFPAGLNREDNAAAMQIVNP